MNIYKFFSNPEYILSTLINNQIYFSQVKDFNDPFEWKFSYKINIEKDKNQIKKYVNENNNNRTEQEKDKIFNHFITNPEILEAKLNESLKYRNNKGVCCFTANKNKLNILMWSYYANSHTGVAFGFDKNSLKIVCSDNKKNNLISSPNWKNVSYQNIPLNINPFDENRLPPNDYEFIKSELWKKEQEIRAVSPNIGQHFYNIESLKEIILGVNICENLQITIMNLLKQKKEFDSIKLFKCTLETSKSELELTKIN